MSAASLPILARASATPPVIFPFADDASNLLFGGPSLRALQAEAAHDAGLALVDVDAGDALPAGTVAFVARDVVFSAATLRALVDESRRRSRTCRAAVKHGTALHLASTRLLGGANDEDFAVDLFAGDLAGRVIADVDAEVVVVADEEDAAVVDVRPYGRAPHELRIARVERLLGRPTHWLHVLDLSLAALQTRLRARVVVKRGKRAPLVHPTALVENSVLGAGVRVEAGAAVIDSFVGEDAVVADHTVVHGSVIGAGCRTLVDTHLRRVVAMPGSTLSNLDMQDAIFGSEVFLTTGVAFFADGPGADVVVDGKDSGRAVLSGAIGTRTVLGSRALFRCGVAVPAQALVVARPGEALGKLDARSLERTVSHHGDRSRDV